MLADRSPRASSSRATAHDGYTSATEHDELTGPEGEVDELEESTALSEVKREPGIGDDVSPCPWKKRKNLFLNDPNFPQDDDDLGPQSGTSASFSNFSNTSFNDRASSAMPPAASTSTIASKPRASSATPFRPFDFSSLSSPSKKRILPLDNAAPSSTTVAELKDELARARSAKQTTDRNMSALRAETKQLQKALDDARADADNARAESRDTSLKYEKIRALQSEFQGKISHFSDRVTNAARSWSDGRERVVAQLSMPGIATVENMRALFEAADAHITEMYGAWNEAVGTPDSQGSSATGTSAMGASSPKPKKQGKQK